MADLPGIYLHVPFCAGGKCPYCDFYSVPFSPTAARRYAVALTAAMDAWAPRAAGRVFGSVYFGGGTPSLLGKDLAALLDAVRARFSLSEDAEITFEANPGTLAPGLFAVLRRAGFNRVSLGLQSARGEELARLGRRHSAQDAAQAVREAADAGFDNISADLMLATPGQTVESLRRSAAFVSMPGVKHVSAYLLKIEPGTPFAAKQNTLALPDEDGQCALYLEACSLLEEHGYRQYEISNFAMPGFEARHNLVYWHAGEYLGLGPAAHGFFGGRRFHFPRSLDAFCNGAQPEDDGEGGSFEESCMLRLRLCEGLSDDVLKEQFGKDLSAFSPRVVARLRAAGLVETPPGTLRLTRRGFLVSNAVIAELLFSPAAPGHYAG